MHYFLKNIFTDKKWLSLVIIVVGVITGIFIGNFFVKDTKISKKEKHTNQIQTIMSSMMKAISEDFLTPFEVIWANFDFWIKKIPYNASSIDFFFSDEIDETSIQNTSISIIPEVEGTLTVKDRHTLSFVLKKNLEKWKEYTVTLSPSIISKNGISLGKEETFLIIADEEVQPTLVSPSGPISDIKKEIFVMFSQPLIPITSIANQNAYSCPIEIEPQTPGTCEWITTNSVKFTPSNEWKDSTNYTIKLKKRDDLLFPLKETTLGTFETPLLNVTSFYDHKKEGIIMDFNFPVNIEDLKQSIQITKQEETDKTYDFSVHILSATGTVLWWNVHSWTTFLVKLKDNNFFYKDTYTLLITWPLYSSKKWNIAFKNYSENIKIPHIINEGLIEDTYMVRNTLFTYPKSNTITLSFLKEIDINQREISFCKENNRCLPISKEYRKDENKKEEKNTLIIKNESELEFNTNYKLIVSKKSDSKMKEDFIVFFQTYEEPKMLDYTIIDATTSQLSIESPGNIRGYNDVKSLFTLIDKKTNTSIPYSIVSEQTLFWVTGELNAKIYTLNHTLIPKSKVVASFSWKTQKQTKTTAVNDIPQSEKRLMFLWKNYYELYKIYPEDYAINDIVQVQIKNVPKFILEVCEYSFDEFLDTKKQWRDLRCKKPHKKEIQVENFEYWKTITKKLEIEKLIWKKIESPILWVHIRDKAKENESNTQTEEQYWNRSFDNDTLHLIRNNIALVLEKWEKESLLYITDTKWKPVNVDTITFYNCQFEKQTVNYTKHPKSPYFITFQNNDGICSIVVKDNTYYGMLWNINSNNWYESNLFSFDNYTIIQNSNVPSMINIPKLYDNRLAYIYTDKPLYRPWDTVFFKWIIKKFDGKTWYQTLSWKEIDLQILNYNLWSELTSMRVTIGEFWNFSWSFTLPKDVQLWRYYFSILGTQGSYYYTFGGFSIQEYKKRNFKVDIIDHNKKERVLPNEKLSFTVEPKYYFWGNIVKAKGKYHIYLQNYYGYSDYLYITHQKERYSQYFYNDSIIESKEFQTDEHGKYNITIDLQELEKKAKEKKISLEEKIITLYVEITEPQTQKTVTETISKIVHATDGYITLQANRYYINRKDGVTLNVYWHDYENNIVTGKDAVIEIYTVKPIQVQEQWIDGIFYYSYDEERTLEKTIPIQDTEKKGKVTYTYVPEKSNTEYIIEAKYTGKNKKTYTQTIRVYVYDRSDDQIFYAWENENQDITEIITEKSIYSVWENATFSVKSSINTGSMLVILSSYNAILTGFVVPIQSYLPSFSLKIDESHIPGITIKTFLIWREQDGTFVYKIAGIPIHVSSEPKKLTVKITTDKKQYKPGDPMSVTVEVFDIHGKPVKNANGSISIVDQSLLALAGNPKKDPFSFFYKTMFQLRTYTYSNLKILLKQLKVKHYKDGEKWWDGWIMTNNKIRGVFKDTAFWESDFFTDEKGKATLSIPRLPDNLTTWGIEVIVFTKDHKIGVAYENVKTQLDLMIEDNLPRFLHEWDVITLMPQVFNYSNKNIEVDVSIQVSHGNEKEKKEKLVLPAGTSKIVPFTISIEDKENIWNNIFDIFSFTMTVQTEKEKLFDGVTLKIPILPQQTQEAVTVFWKLEKTKDTFTQRILPLKKWILEVTYAGSILWKVENSFLKFLWHYPYGCLEQRTSSFIGHVYLKHFYNTIGKWEEYDLKKITVQKYISEEKWTEDVSIDTIIKEYLALLPKYQTNNWGFTYWDESDNVWWREPNVWLTEYIVASLSMIQKIGYKIDESMLRNAKNYLKNNIAVSNDAHSIVDIYRLLTHEDIIDEKELFELFLQRKEFFLEEEKKHNIYYLFVLGHFAHSKNIDEKKRKELKKEFDTIIDTILSNYITYTQDGAIPKNEFIPTWWECWWWCGYTNITITYFHFVTLVSKWKKEKKYKEFVASAMKYITKFLSNKGTSYLSTYNIVQVIKILSKYVEEEENIKNIDQQVFAYLNQEEIEKTRIHTGNFLQSYSFKKNIDHTVFSWGDLSLHKEGTGTIYYNMVASYFVHARNIPPLNRGFELKREFYSYPSGEQKEENLSWILLGKIGDIIEVRNTVVVSNYVQDVFLESFIPSWSEIINSSFANEIQIGSWDIQVSNSNGYSSWYGAYYNRTEIRDDRLFMYFSYLYPWTYTIRYFIRLTHPWVFQVKPSMIQEFYSPQTFWRSAGSMVVIESK